MPPPVRMVQGGDQDTPPPEYSSGVGETGRATGSRDLKAYQVRMPCPPPRSAQAKWSGSIWQQAQDGVESYLTASFAREHVVRVHGAIQIVVHGCGHDNAVYVTGAGSMGSQGSSYKSEGRGSEGGMNGRVGGYGKCKGRGGLFTSGRRPAARWRYFSFPRWSDSDRQVQSGWLDKDQLRLRLVD